MEDTTRIEMPELTEAINRLTEALLSGKPKLTEAPLAPAVPQTPPAPATIPISPPVAPAAAPTTVAAVPTAASRTFTRDDLARAGAALVDAGKQAALVALLGKYGVQAVNALDASQYGAFATDLRGLGANI